MDVSSDQRKVKTSYGSAPMGLVGYGFCFNNYKHRYYGTSSETQTLSETFDMKSVALKVILDDAMAISDNIKRSLNRSINQTITATDSILRRIELVFSDTMNAFDSKTKILYRRIVDSETISEIFSFARFLFKNDSMAISDFILSIIKNIKRTMSDSMSIFDERTFFRGKVFTEGISLSDFIYYLRNGVSVLWTKVAKTVKGIWKPQRKIR